MDSQGPHPFDERELTRRTLLKYGAGAIGGMSLLGALGACGGGGEAAETGTTETEGSRGGSLRYALGDGSDRDTLDPALGVNAVMLTANSLVYDNLLHTDNEWNLTPSLAEDWSVNDDATEYSFKLRQGVEFHSGKTLEAQDVADHILRLLDESTGSGGLSLLGSVLDPDGVKVGDPTTITFSLKEADGFFGVKMAHYYTRIPESGTTDWLKSSPGTGPFRSVAFRPGEGAEFIRNENYWRDDVPILDEISLVVIPEQATKTEAVLNGDVDLSDPPPLAAVDQFDASDVASLIAVSASPYTIDIDSSIKPFSDPRVSRAMKMMIDRQKALDFIVRGRGVVSADSLIHPDDPFYPPDLEPYPYDPEQARALLAEAGYPDGFQVELWSTNAYPYLDEGAAVAKEAFDAGGIEATIQSVSSDRYLEAFLNEPVVMDYYLPQHPGVVFDLYYASGPQNTTRLNDKQTNTWVTEFKRTTDRTRQIELANDIIRRYNEIAAEIVPFHFDDLWAHKNRVKNLIRHPMSKFEFAHIRVA